MSADKYEIEPEMQRPDWEPVRPSGCITINGVRIHGMTCAQASHIVKAVEAFAALDADKERLDWLEEMSRTHSVLLLNNKKHGGVWWTSPDNRGHITAYPLRAALDSARSPNPAKS